MDISIFGYKFNLEVLILIGVVYLILVGHTICGCCNRMSMEGFQDASGGTPVPGNKLMGTQVGNGNIAPATSTTIAPKVKNTINGKSGTEGFVGANTNYGQSSQYDLNAASRINTASWSTPNLTVVKGEPLNNAVKQFLNRKEQPVPLPEGEMLMFADTEFKPECCPNTYSNSQGCACMTGKQYNYLILRGGNNTPYSEY